MTFANKLSLWHDKRNIKRILLITQNLESLRRSNKRVEESFIDKFARFQFWKLLGSARI